MFICHHIIIVSPVLLSTWHIFVVNNIDALSIFQIGTHSFFSLVHSYYLFNDLCGIVNCVRNCNCIICEIFNSVWCKIENLLIFPLMWPPHHTPTRCQKSILTYWGIHVLLWLMWMFWYTIFPFILLHLGA